MRFFIIPVTLFCAYLLAPVVAADDFLADNAKRPGVVTAENGFQYKVITEGQGESPRPLDLVTVHYHGTLTNGTVFDSSVERGRPASFALNQVIPGWTQGLQTMKPGGKTIFYIPAQLGYGDRAVGEKIPANATLIFEVELIKVTRLNIPASPQEAIAYKVSDFACGAVPQLPEEKLDQDKHSALLDKSQVYIDCVQNYYNVTNTELQGVTRMAGKAQGEEREKIIDNFSKAKQDFRDRTAVAVDFFKRFQAASQK